MYIIIQCVLNVLGSSPWEEMKDTKVTFSVFVFVFFSLDVYILSATFEMKFWLLVILLILYSVFSSPFALHSIPSYLLAVAII